jgi:iron(III) transport system permease protein
VAADAAVVARGAARPERVLHALYWLTFATVLLLVLVPFAALVYGSLRTAAPGEEGAAWTLQNFANLASPGVVTTPGEARLAKFCNVQAPPASPGAAVRRLP